MTRARDIDGIETLDAERVELRIRMAVLNDRTGNDDEIARLEIRLQQLNAKIARARTNGRQN